MRSGWLALFAIVLAYACGGKTDSEPALCEPGTELTCPPPCLGVSTCATDGSGWSSCCGSGGSGYGGSGGAVGSGGAGSGGVAGNGGNAGSGGSGGGVMCESTYCGDYHLAGFVLPGCCPGYNSCGASIAPEVSEALSLPTGCIDTEQSGNNDASCPGLSYVDPFDGQKKEYPGCCRGGSTTCGVKVDFVLDLGPYFGCIDAGPASGQVCGSPSCVDCIQSQCQDALQTCLSEATCSAIASCSLGCEDKACVDTCVQQNPGDPDVFDQLVDCANVECPRACVGLTG